MHIRLSCLWNNSCKIPNEKNNPKLSKTTGHKRSKSRVHLNLKKVKAKTIKEMKSKAVNFISERNLEVIPCETGRKGLGVTNRKLFS